LLFKEGHDEARGEFVSQCEVFEDSVLTERVNAQGSLAETAGDDTSMTTEEVLSV